MSRLCEDAMTAYAGMRRMEGGEKMKKQKSIFSAMKCIYCGNDCEDHWIAVCKRCLRLWNENWKKYMPVDDSFKKLEDECEEYIRQAMTAHTCGKEACIGGDIEDRFFSSDCIGCCPDTKQHYRNAAQMVIAWTQNRIKENIMKNVLLKEKRGEDEQV